MLISEAGSKRICLLQTIPFFCKSLKNFVKALFFFINEMELPRSMAKKITWSIFPSISDLKGFSGMMLIKTSKIDGGSWIVNWLALKFAWIFSPGPTMELINKEIVIAVKVVKMYKNIVLIPILPRVWMLLRFATPVTKEKKTIGWWFFKYGCARSFCKN